MRYAHRLMVIYICAKSFKNVINLSRVRERTLNIVIQCLTMNYDLDLQPTLAKHTHCTTTHHTWHLRRVFCKSQGFKIYRAATTHRHTDRRTDGRTVEQTDIVTTELNNMAPHFMGEEILVIQTKTSVSFKILQSRNAHVPMTQKITTFCLCVLGKNHIKQLKQAHLYIFIIIIISYIHVFDVFSYQFQILSRNVIYCSHNGANWIPFYNKTQ